MGRSDTKVPPYRSMGRPTSPHSTPQKRMALRTPQLPHTSMGHPKPHDPTLLIYGAATPPSSAPHIYEALRLTHLTLQIYWAPHNPMLCPTHLWGAPNPAPQPHIASHTSMSCSDPQTPPHTFPSCPIETNGAQNPTSAPHIDGAPLMLPHSPRFRPTHLWGTQSFRSGATPQISGAAPLSCPPLTTRCCSPCDALHAPPQAPPLPLHRPAFSARKGRRFRRTTHPTALPLPPYGTAASALLAAVQGFHFRRRASAVCMLQSAAISAVQHRHFRPLLRFTEPPLPPYSNATSAVYSPLQHPHFRP